MSLTKTLLSTAFIAGLAACSGSDTSSVSSIDAEPFQSDIMSPDGAVLGTVTLTDLGADGTRVSVDVTGISPGTHAMHFHETGNCSATDFTSAGGHFNPTLKEHGFNMADGPHAGDMMNVEVGENGEGSFTVTNERVSLNGDDDLPSLLDDDGTALILHAKADDYESQPSGAAGPRIGCAEITG